MNSSQHALTDWKEHQATALQFPIRGGLLAPIALLRVRCIVTTGGALPRNWPRAERSRYTPSEGGGETTCARVDSTPKHAIRLRSRSFRPTKKCASITRFLISSL